MVARVGVVQEIETGGDKPSPTFALIATAGGEEADRLREALAPALSTARTGMELVAFLRASPLVGEDLVFERDRSVGREADLEGLEIPE